jgi:hypothetical protein
MQGHGDAGTRDGDTETGRHGDTETGRQGDTGTRAAGVLYKQAHSERDLWSSSPTCTTDPIVLCPNDPIILIHDHVHELREDVVVCLI